ncbi:MAG TPA: LptA/OstA family protein [Acidisarcina sp.]
MSGTISRLRTAIIVLATVLVAAIVIFLAFARYERRRLVRDLPAKLGLQIQESADSFTLSKSDKGHTIFTIHASKAVQYKDGGHATLHDVSISLYGPHGDRADSIRGAEFDYDKKSGIATAAGQVEIDFQPPAPGTAGSSAAAVTTEAGKAPSSSGGIIHVKTSGLVFDKNSGMATTRNLVEFETPQGSGHATGASYNSQEGVLVLESAVQLDSSSNGKPVSLKAEHAQITRDSRQAFLLNAVAEYDGERTSSDSAIVYFRPDGSAEHVDAKGHVEIAAGGGQQLKAETAQMLFDQHSQPQHIDLAGGIFLVANDQVHHMHGAAVEAKLQYGAGSILQHVQLLNAVSFVDQQIRLPDDPNGSTTREVRAQQIEIDFAPGSGPGEGEHSIAQRVLASGGATVVLHTISARHPQQNTTIGAETLLAELANGNAITSVKGSGQTRIVDVASDGATQTSTGDNLVLSFLPVTGRRVGARKSEVALPATEIQSALQQGNVVITRTAAFGAKQPSEPVRITAGRAEYRSADELLHLSGNPRFTDGALDLSGDQIDYQRLTGSATATGNIKATYLQRSGQPAETASAAGRGSFALGGPGPAHIVADSATINRAAGKDQGSAAGDAIFRGHARLWQGSNSIAAPVIQLSRSGESLKAHGDAQSAATSGGGVTATLISPGGPEHKASTDHIHSRELLYSEVAREATFSGSVLAQDAGGTIRSDQAVVFLVPATRSAGSSSVRGTSTSQLPEPTGVQTQSADGGKQDGAHATAAASTGGPEPRDGAASDRQSQIDHIVATGHVILEQPGRRATGDKLIYASQDGTFTLTGTPEVAPRLIDEIHGTVTGASLIFNSRDDSVTVSGGQSRASTDTRVRR